LDLLIQHTDSPGVRRMIVASVHGALWLQTHFPEEEWGALLSGQACFGMDCISDLLNDARSAGLNVTAPVVFES
tara:strand:+ start:156 stop:377 length:222 start_codon:yes stop_codon:yes gene_type:complete